MFIILFFKISASNYLKSVLGIFWIPQEQGPNNVGMIDQLQASSEDTRVLIGGPGDAVPLEKFEI